MRANRHTFDFHSIISSNYADICGLICLIVKSHIRIFFNHTLQDETIIKFCVRRSTSVAQVPQNYSALHQST